MSKTVKFVKGDSIKNVLLSEGVEEQLKTLGWKRSEAKRGRPAKKSVDKGE